MHAAVTADVGIEPCHLVLRSGPIHARLLIVISIAACSGNTATPDVDAPPDPPAAGYDADAIVPYTVTPYDIDRAGHVFKVTVYMPTSAGPHPLVGLSCGSTQIAAGYAIYGKRLASYGIAVVIENDPGFSTNTGYITPDAAYVIDTWVPATLGDQIDLTKVGLAGHSRGGAVSMLIASTKLHGKVVAWFGIDPVDNQFGQAPRQYGRTDLASIGIPTAFLGAEVTSNCAPAADNYRMLYPRAPSPSVLVVGLGAGHTQFEPADACNACSICSPNGTADPNVVLAYANRYVTAFFARELLGDSSVGAAFEGALAADDVAAGHVTIMSK